MTRTAKWSFGLAMAGMLAANLGYAEVDKKIERTWKSKCASCHGKEGKGDTEKGKKMKIADYTTADWQKSKKDEDLKKAILDGVKAEKDGVKQEMDGYKADLKPEEIDGLVAFIRGLKK